MWIKLAIATIGALSLDIVETRMAIKKASIVGTAKVIFYHMSKSTWIQNIVLCKGLVYI